MTIREAISRRCSTGATSPAQEAHAVMGEIMDGEATPAQIAGLLVALRAKGETADEIAGCAEAMREHMVAGASRARAGRRRGRHRWRRSGHVQHLDGGRARRRGRRCRCREARQPRRELRVRRRRRPRGARDRARADPGADRAVDRRARLRVHVRARAPSGDAARGAGAAGARRSRTVFNVLGPLSNPAGARDGVFGVYSAALARTYAEALAELGARRAFVVHGDGGIDELSPVRPQPRRRGASTAT